MLLAILLSAVVCAAFVASWVLERLSQRIDFPPEVLTNGAMMETLP
jgi:hypothetical protein